MGSKPYRVAIVPAAGIGSRFSREQKKTFVNLGGIPLIAHTLRALEHSELITEIIPSVMEEDREIFVDLMREFNFKKIKKIASGGKERQDSVNNALNLIKEADVVLIHDGVRPFVTDKLINSLISSLNGCDGVVPGVPLRDTIKEVGEDGIVLSTPKRERLFAVQTPQVFNREIIKRAYERAYIDKYYATDDAALLERIGGKVRIIRGSLFNIKITFPEDIILGEFILKRLEAFV